MTTVRHILEDKGHQIWSVCPGDTVYDAIRMMADKDVGSLVVLDDSKIVGIITERDYARNVFLKGRASPQTRVDDIMERNVVCVKPDQSIEECMALMTTKRLRHLPVTESGALLGNNLSTATVHRNEPLQSDQGVGSCFRERLVVARQSSRQGAGLRGISASQGPRG